jgi:fucose permease
MKRSITVGLVLIIVGTVLILQRTIGLSVDVWGYIWPLFLIIPGISLHINYFSKKSDSGSLIVGGILVTYGLLFLIHALTNGEYNEVLSFVYPMGIGIGFFESYLFGDKKNANLSLAMIFLFLALYILLRNVFPELSNLRDYIIPGLLIVLGVFVLFKNLIKNNR